MLRITEEAERLSCLTFLTTQVYGEGASNGSATFVTKTYVIGNIGHNIIIKFWEMAIVISVQHFT